ncbi:unnamed protein product [Ixodes pacificus]
MQNSKYVSRSSILHSKMTPTIFAFVLFCASNMVSAEMWCYSCISNQPGCKDDVNWLIHHAITCPRADDKCVKIVERKGSEVLYTRDCLSNLEFYRHDIPADTYEGCRPAAESPKLAVYVDNEIKELELKRDYYTSVDYCFCEFYYWCNAAASLSPMWMLPCLLALVQVSSILMHSSL